jgi:hypothetical protein
MTPPRNWSCGPTQRARRTGSPRTAGSATSPFSVGYAIDDRVRIGLPQVDDDTWSPAVDGNGEHRPGTEVVELTDVVDLSAWPTGTRLSVRREKQHPGAQLTLSDRDWPTVVGDSRSLPVKR